MITPLLTGLLAGLVLGYALGYAAAGAVRRAASAASWGRRPVVDPTCPAYWDAYEMPPYYGKQAQHALPSVEPTRTIPMEDLLNGY